MEDDCYHGEIPTDTCLSVCCVSHKNTIDMPSHPFRVILIYEKTRGWGFRNFTTSCVECAELVWTWIQELAFLLSWALGLYVAVWSHGWKPYLEMMKIKHIQVQMLRALPSYQVIWAFYLGSGSPALPTSSAQDCFNCSCVRTVLQLQRCGLEVGMLSYILLVP